MKKTINIGLGLAFGVCTIVAPSFTSAQTTSGATQGTSTVQEPSSLGDYARKVHKDTQEAPKPKPKVFDNDNLPRDESISVVGAPAAADATQAGSTTPDSKDAAAAKPAAPADDQAKKQAAWKQWKDKLSAQKDAIDLASRELDVLQREYQLRAAEMYADVGNRLRNSTQWDKQEAQYKQQIADKQKAVEDAKQKLTDMQEEARKAGVPSSMLD